MSAWNSKYSPLINSPTLDCLTEANWQEVSIQTCTYDLTPLLLKPGYEFLKNLDNLQAYLNCKGRLILNASSLQANKSGIVTIRSPLDGSQLKLSLDEIADLIIHLKPQAVILPKGFLNAVPNFLEELDKKIIPYLAWQEDVLPSLERKVGAWIDSTLPKATEALTGPLYYQNVTFKQIAELKLNADDLVETDEPARLARDGLVYSGLEILDLKDPSMEKNFEPIDSECDCPTCSNLYTKAYLHHLYQHTPLLCHRFLMQHNVAIFLGPVYKSTPPPTCRDHIITHKYVQKRV